MPGYFKTNFEYPLTHWRNKKLFGVTQQEIQAFELDSKSLKLQASKKDNVWTLNFGDGAVAGDIEAVDSLLAALTNTNAKDFVSETKDDTKTRKTLASAPRFLKYNLTVKDGSKISFEVYSAEKPEKKAFALVSNQDYFYELESSSLNALLKKREELRMAKLITSLERFTFKAIQFESTSYKSAIKVTLKDTKWLRETDQKVISDKKIQTLFDSLSGNRIKEYLVKGPAGIESGLTVSFFEDKPEAKRKYIFWKSNDIAYAKDLLSGRSEIYKLDSSLQGVLPWTADFLELPDTPTPGGDAKAAVPKVIGQPGARHDGHDGHDGHSHTEDHADEE